MTTASLFIIHRHSTVRPSDDSGSDGAGNRKTERNMITVCAFYKPVTGYIHDTHDHSTQPWTFTKVNKTEYIIYKTKRGYVTP